MEYGVHHMEYGVHDHSYSFLIIVICLHNKSIINKPINLRTNNLHNNKIKYIMYPNLIS